MGHPVSARVSIRRIFIMTSSPGADEAAKKNTGSFTKRAEKFTQKTGGG